MKARMAVCATRWNSRSAIAGRMLRSIPTIAPTKALTSTSRPNCPRFARRPSRIDPDCGSKARADFDESIAGNLDFKAEPTDSGRNWFDGSGFLRVRPRRAVPARMSDRGAFRRIDGDDSLHVRRPRRDVPCQVGDELVARANGKRRVPALLEAERGTRLAG